MIYFFIELLDFDEPSNLHNHSKFFKKKYRMGVCLFILMHHVRNHDGWGLTWLKVRIRIPLQDVYGILHQLVARLFGNHNHEQL